MPDIPQLTKLVELLGQGGSAVLAAILLVLTFLQRKDLEVARNRIVELENRVFELSSTYNRTVRRFEAGFSQTRELMNRIFDRL